MKNLIIFDYDGVLVDSFELNKRIYKDLSVEFNLDLPNNSDYYRELWELDWRETMKKLGLSTKEDFEKNYIIYSNGLKKYGSMVKPYDDIPEVLKSLSKKYKLAVVSHNFRDEIKNKLKEFNLLQFFDVTYGAEDGELKPSPDMLIKCMKKLNIKPKNTSFIGDMDGDIQSGRAAKLGKIIAVTYGFHLKNKLMDADIIIDNPIDLIKKF